MAERLKARAWRARVPETVPWVRIPLSPPSSPAPRRARGAIRFDASDAIPDPVDDDADGQADIADNCVGVANPDQHDGDLDDLSDLCDPSLEASFVLFESEPGDYIGQGLRQHRNAANGVIRIELGVDGTVTVNVDGAARPIVL